MAAPFVHESAVVDPGVELGEDVKVWHFVHLCEGARIGAGTSLGQNVFVARGVRVGARVKVQNNVSLYEGVEIEDDAFLGPSAVFTNVINPRSFVARKHEYRATYVGRGASIGANATVVCGVRIGEYAFVAAGAIITRDVVPHALMVGTPARRTAFMCRCGEKLSASGSVTCAACQSTYRIEGELCAPLVEASGAARDEKAASAVREVPFFDLAAQNGPLAPALRAAFERVLTSNQFIMGPDVEELERELCATLGFRHAITVSSGTDALLLSLMALDIGPGAEVITSSFSFFATAGCIARVGATPVFVDIDPRTLNLDASKLERAITSRTRAVLPVHLFGLAADMDAILQVANAHGLAVIEDAAQALGTHFRDKPVGSLGAFGCFSFFPSKNLGGFGDGGLVTTERDDLADRARLLRTHGGRPKYFHRAIGGNFRLDTLQAALLRVKLPALAGYAKQRRAHAAFYDQAFAALEQAGKLIRPKRDAGHVYNQYVIRSQRRDGLRAALKAAGVGSDIYYPRGLHEQECFANLGYARGSLPETERATAEVLALPIFPELSQAQRAYVASSLSDYLEKA
jgi:dTDP-4-amino-4,6-dideoxygalactose transaminase/acetyltransferase-like isoleucine patch superfamily enzyme